MAFINTGVQGRRVRAISMFSGMEAATVAASDLPWDFIALAEQDPTACWVLHSHYGCGRPRYMPLPDHAADGRTRKERETNIRKVSMIPQHSGQGICNLGDMTQVDWSMYKGKVDVVVGGPPCQSFSFAGDRKSLGDTRGNLSLSYMRAIHEIQPLWCLTENVPGWLGTSDNAFGHFLGGIVGASAPLNPPCGRKWGSAGMVDGPLYRAAWRILDAQGFVPQRRRRVFVVASRVGSGGDPVRVLFETQAEVERNLGNRFRSGPLFLHGKGGGGDPVPSGTPGQGDPSTHGKRVSGGSREGAPEQQISTSYSLDMIPNVKASSANLGYGNRASLANHAVDPFLGDGTEAVFLHCNKGRPNGRASAHVGIVTVKSIIETLTTDGHSQSPIVIPGSAWNDNETPTFLAKDPLKVRLHTDSQANVCPQGAVITPTGTDLIYQDSQYGVRAYDSAGTLRAGRIPEHQMVLVPESQTSAPIDGIPESPEINTEMLVRRITPNECLALQGFPVEYLDAVTIGNKQLPDGPRYKLTGNSWAVPVVRWIFNRMDQLLQEQLERAL